VFNIIYADLLEKINSEKKQIILMGDFNIDLLNAETCPYSDAFLHNNLENCVKPFITRPTCVTSHSKTLIDNIFSNFITNDYSAGNLICTISDHLPQFLILNMEISKNNATQKYFQDYNKFSNEKLDTIIKTINKVILEHAPVKLTNIKSNNNDKQWITGGIQKIN